MLNAELEQASRAKSNFLASMSHELRTPMNAILGFTEMIRDGIYGDVPEEIREPVADIHTCGRQLLALINNVLDLSKIEAGRMELALGDYVVDDVVSPVRQALRSLAAAKGLGLEVVVPPETPLCFGDGKRLTQCVMNLAGNALKFTREGRVEIRVEVQEEDLQFAVADTGIGIPAADLPRITERFYRVDKARSRELGGTGLGLAIVKHLVLAHGGELRIESQEQQGTTVRFTLPIQPAV